MKNKNLKKNKAIITILLMAAGALAIAFGARAEAGGAIFTALGIAAMVGGIFLGISGKGKKKAADGEEHSYTITSTANVDRMEGHEFEYFCAELLERCGFEEVEVTRGSGDQGVDILAKKEDIKYAIQCKNYSNPLGNTPVQEVYAGKTFYRCHVGVVMTNSTFTKGALELADSVGVILWDKDRLDKMMIKVGMQEFSKNKSLD